MAKSPKCGTHSSQQTIRHRDDSLQTLAALVESTPVHKISDALGSDAELHLVGGTVRDTIEGLDTGTDIDLASKLTPENLLQILDRRGFRVIATGLKHGTITCAIDGYNIEITSFRAGRGEHANTIEDDLAGRDFTLNAVAYSVKDKILIDPFNGISAIEKRVVEAVESPKRRFEEDPLRILRMVRFGPASGRVINEETSKQAMQMASLLSNVSVERIRHELEKIVMGSTPDDGVRALHTFGLLPYTWPELIPTIGFEQNRFHVHDVFDHTLDVLRRCPLDRVIRLAAVYHDIGKAHTLSLDADGNRHFYEHEKVSAEICKESMQRLRFSNDDIEAVSTIVRLHMRPFDCGPSGVRRVLRDAGSYYSQWREFKNADRPAVFDDALYEQHILRFDEMVEAEKHRGKGSVFSRLAISGEDLIALGLRPGKFLGSILKDLQSAVLDDPELNDKDALLRLAKQMIKERSPE